MRLSRGRVVAVVLAFVCCAPSTRAGIVRIVEPSGTQTFTTIQAAVDAASSGDVLLVADGTYPPFTLGDKSLSIVAAPGATVAVTGPVEITGVSTANVVLQGLSVTSPDYGMAGLKITGCTGHVRLQGCTVTGAPGTNWGEMGGHGVHVTGSDRVVLVGCILRGGRGANNYQTLQNGGAGGSGLHVQSSRVGLYDCTLEGGTGGDGEEDGGRGGYGCRTFGPQFFATTSVFRGGQGGFGVFSNCGEGGNGLAIAGPPAVLLQNQYQAGAAGCGGFPTLPLLGPNQQLPGVARRFSATPIAGDGQAWNLQVTGLAGDRVFLRVAGLPGFRTAYAFGGLLLVPFPLPVAIEPLGIVPASGSLSVPVTLSDLPATTISSRYFIQGTVIDAQGALRVGNALHLALLNRDFGPDCNGDGVQDFVEVIEGGDANANLVPDACDGSGPVWHVNASAAPGGNGSAGAPFQAIGQALAVALSGHTILVADGVYSGPFNRDLDFAGRALTLRSLNGPGACVIDCERQGRGFLFQSGETRSAVLQGFTILNGDAANAISGPNDQGGGIFVANSGPTIELCAISGCSASFMGGGIGLWFANARVRYSTIASNQVTGQNGRGGGLCSFLGQSQIHGCWIENNISSNEGGGVWLVEGRLSHCYVRANSASFGGGLMIAGDGFMPEIDDILIAGNAAPWGAGLVKDGTSTLTLTNATIVGNASPNRGSGLTCTATGFEDGGTTLLRNTLVWDNPAPNGQAIALSSLATLDVRFSDAQGGPSSVFVDLGSTLIWGAGNLDVDPVFVDADGADNDPASFLDNDYHLSAFSPCIDAADSLGVPADLFDLDSDGNTSEPVPIALDAQARIVDDPSVPDTGSGPAPIVDIGCYERQP